ncbi:MAG: FUSC family protein [Nitrosomonas sp.]|nr:FUSC family protein [Nitrosomonas sp.]
MQLSTVICNELASFPGRTAMVWRSLLSSALIIIISMTLQVPFLALSLVIVFFTAQENTVLTKLSSIIMVIGVTLAVALAILLLKFTIDFPLLRILGACSIAFCGMYFMRISKLGSLGYMVALIVIYGQSFPDINSDPEIISRLLLWSWVAVVYPIVITIIVNFLLLPAKPVRLLTDEILRQLGDVNRQLEARRSGHEIPQLDLDTVQRGILTLHRHLVFAAQGDAAYGRDKARHLMRIAAVDRLHTAAAHLSQLPAGPLSPAQSDCLANLHASCQKLEAAVAAGTVFEHTLEVFGDRPVTDRLDGLLREMTHALQAVANADVSPPTELPKVKTGMLAADAFSNPVYGQFALKTVFAAMICYVFYTAVQWSGIHTALLTCIILALPSVGAAAQKGLTRVVGVALGSITSLLATVFIIPHLDSIVGLLALTLPVIAAGSWIAAGSPRTNYAGVQLAFSFALALLGSFGPTTDITEIRDRMIGVLVGVTVYMTISATLWPEREGKMLNTTLARLLRSIAELALAGQKLTDLNEKHQAVDKARLQGWELLNQNRELQARVALEPGWQNAHDSVTGDLTTWLAKAQEALFAVNFFQLLLLHAGPQMTPAVSEAIRSFWNSVAQQLENLAECIENASPVTENTAVDEPLTPASALDALVKALTEESHEAIPNWELLSAARTVHERIEQLNHRHSQLLEPNVNAQ